MGFIDRIRNAVKDWWNDDRHALPRFVRDVQLDRVGYYVLTYNPETEENRLDYEHIRRADLNSCAVHLSGSGDREYFRDLDDAGEYPKPGYMNATDLYLYLVNNDLRDANNVKRKTPFILDTKTAGLIVLALAAFAVVFLYKFVI